MSWFETVAKKADVDVETTQKILRKVGVAGPRPVPARRRLRVNALHFAGVKNLESPDDEDVREFTPFSFTRAFDTSVTALVSNGQNRRGKTSILEILSWGLRGSTHEVQSDVRSWLREVCLLLTIAGERVLIAWRVENGDPRGSIIQLPKNYVVNLDEWDERAREAMEKHAALSRAEGAPVFTADVPVDQAIAQFRADNVFIVSSFTNAEEMAQAISDFMMDRLALEELVQWTLHSYATAADDGGAVQHSWPLWSQAMVISKPSHSAVIGETPQQAHAVLGTFLATEWTSTRNVIRAHKNVVNGQRTAIQRRLEADTAARTAGAEELTRELHDLQEELQALPPERVTPEQATALSAAASAASLNVQAANDEFLAAALVWGRAERAREQATFDLEALREAAVTKRFWHSLKPSCCPRCDARVEKEQWAREQEGSCSLCNNPIGVLTAEVDTPAAVDAEEDLDPLVIAEERLIAAEADVTTTSTAHDAAKVRLVEAKAAFDEANSAFATVHTDPGVRRDLERRISVLEGRIQERTTVAVAEDEQPLITTFNVLNAAEKVADAALTVDRNDALAAASARITTLGRELGMTNLESAKLKANAHLDVSRGGVTSTFGKLDDGSKLRLKIAVVVALLEVGAATGLGRHPGLLVVDSLAREELNEGDGEHLLEELYRVAEAHGLQVVIGTTHSELVDAVLPDEAVVRPQESGFMW